MIMQDWNDIQIFTEVAQSGSFTAAAIKLEVPKSKVSRRVAALESRLGVRLLHRTTRTLSLTQAGTAFLQHCQVMRQEAEAAEDVVAGLLQEPRGTVRITCPVTVAHTWLGALMPGFLRKNPLVRVEMQVTNRVVNPVEEGIDVALRVRSSLDESGSLVIKRLGYSRQELVAARELLPPAGFLTRPEDLDGLETIAMSALDGQTTWVLQAEDGRVHEFTHRPRYVADDLQTLRLAVLQGVGITLLPVELCWEDIHAGRLLKVLPGWAMPRGYVHAVFASRRGMSTAVRSFLDYLGTEREHNEHWFGAML
ncbi:LysR family transcriptional regulator [Saezia sanguinis]|uniref:LysR family transcriptional regulator n=1 Tax=Saezia sanguinis TaxID=1965230 RepID=UPI0030DAF8F0